MSARRLILVRHASTEAVRRAAFPADEPLDSSGEAAARALAGRLGRAEAMCSPARRALATAAAMGLQAQPDRALEECDFGSWRGRTLAEVDAEDPAATQAWMTDPGACPHGGETLRDFAARVAGWLDAQAELDGRAVAVTHGGVVRAAVVHALGAPIDAVWRLDAMPLRITELNAHDGRWTLARLNASVDEASSADA